jgi:hypothetical protein
MRFNVALECGSVAREHNVGPSGRVFSGAKADSKWDHAYEETTAAMTTANRQKSSRNFEHDEPFGHQIMVRGATATFAIVADATFR